MDPYPLLFLQEVARQKVKGLWQRGDLCVLGQGGGVRSTKAWTRASNVAPGFEHERDHPEVARIDCVGIR